MTALAARRAADLTPSANPAESHQVLTFLLGVEMFAIGILHIKEIIEYGGLTTVPMMPSCVRGVINLRGSVVSVVDLAIRFGRPPSPVTRRSCIVIVEIGAECEAGHRRTEDIGIIVDSVSAVLEIPADRVEPAPAFGSKLRSELVLGMGKVDERFVILLDVDRVLSDEGLGALPDPAFDA